MSFLWQLFSINVQYFHEKTAKELDIRASWCLGKRPEFLVGQEGHKNKQARGACRPLYSDAGLVYAFPRRGIDREHMVESN